MGSKEKLTDAASESDVSDTQVNWTARAALTVLITISVEGGTLTEGTAWVYIWGTV